MNVLVPIALFGWVFVATALFTVMPPRRAVIVAYLAAWMFLPQAGIPFTGLPDLDKVTATSLGAMLGVLLFDAGRLVRFRPSWVDLPMLAFLLAPMPSSITNDLGVYDGLSGVVRETFTWGVPYFIGRLYLTDLVALRELAVAIFIGGLIYVPLCLWEIRMSPQLHNHLYGFHPSHFAMTIRFGGYRPMVFMQHGLMVGMWMTSATLAGAWLWWTGALRQMFGTPMWVLVGGLFVVTVMCKSLGALALLIGGVGLLFINQFTRSSLLLAAILLIGPTYMLVRAQGYWDGQELIDLAEKIDAERAFSLQGRIEDENLLIERASEKPVFGWGGWGRWRVKDEYTGQDLTSSDGLWVIVRGEMGMVGLVANTLIVLVPFVLLLRRIPARQWGHPAVAGAAVLAMMLMLWSIDNLFNAMLNPAYILAAGGISSLYVLYPRQQAAAKQARRQQIAAWQWHMQQQQAEAEGRMRPPRQRPSMPHG